jgi:1-acyl-sn-glycerol-3-phosphate acyltransferase
MTTPAGQPTTATPEPTSGAAAMAALARTSAGYLGLWFGLLTCGTLFLGWCGIAGLISPFMAPAQRRRIGRLGMHRIFSIFLRILHAFGIVKVDNAALLALRHEPALILAPNHPSMMDVVLVISRLENVGCIMKADLWDNPFLGAGARMADFIRNDCAQNMIRLAIRDLQRGSHLLIFPEATRTVRAPVNPLAGGYALVAKKAGASIQTVLIETDSPYLRKGWPLFRLPPMPIRYSVRLGRRFEPREDVDALVAEMERYYIEELERGNRNADALSGAGSPDMRRAA